MARIVCDPGHGGRDRANRGPTSYVEADGVLKCALALASELRASGVEVMLTREGDVDLAGPTWSTKADLVGRTSRGNAWGADLFLSLHTNAANGRTTGTETYCQINNPDSYRAASLIHREIVQSLGTVDRGVRVRDYDSERILPYENRPQGGRDYYHVLREVNCSSVLLEMEYHDSQSGEARLLTPGVLEDKAPKAIARAILSYLGIGQTPILGRAVATLAQGRAWLAQKAPGKEHMADLYYEIAPKYNIRPDVALCQSAKETAFWRYTGQVKNWQFNMAGLAATGTASDGLTPLRGADPARVRFQAGIHGAIFADQATGVEAHIQHLHAYACADPLPSGTVLLSPRFALVKRGSARHVEHLGAAENPTGVGWAYPGKDYGKSIVRDYLSSLLALKVPETPADPDPNHMVEGRDLSPYAPPEDRIVYIQYNKYSALRQELDQLRADLPRVTTERDEALQLIEKIKAFVGL